MRRMLIGMTIMLTLGSGVDIAQAQSWKPPTDAQRCPSKWGAGDQRGAGNHMKPESVVKATRLIKSGEDAHERAQRARFPVILEHTSQLHHARASFRKIGVGGLPGS